MENLRNLSDSMLVELYAAGNNEAFDVLLDRHQGKLFSYILFVVHNEELANDIFQETFVKAIMMIQQRRYVESGRFLSWLMRIAHNMIIDLFRQEKNENTVSDNDVDYDLFNDIRFSELNVESRLVMDQTLDDVRMMVDHLPKNQKEIVYMRYYQEMSFREIAEVTGVSINTALGRMRYALLNLRKMAVKKSLYSEALF